MNICPSCETQMDHGMELCTSCAGADVEEALEAGQAGVEIPSACLELEDGQRFSLVSEETLIGRSDPVDQIEPDVDLSYCGGFEQGVSRRHAVITFHEDGYTLEDLGSTNGTVVNREKVVPGSPVTLVEGDVIHLGRMKAVFHAGEGGLS